MIVKTSSGSIVLSLASIGHHPPCFQDGGHRGPVPAHVILRLEHEDHVAVEVHEGNEAAGTGLESTMPLPPASTESSHTPSP